MDGLLYRQTWRSRVADLLDDPVGQALLARDGLSRDEVLRQLAPVAESLARRDRRPERAALKPFAS